ncbi:hypothetical protein DICPUDRAFT_149887 [Dictyostelium purpureum]|uniref:Uncharacterized protein n=1 Tax=Dictyostelium purpureum TaxID=5786 RepID=F0ZEX0_DICPU|nr:uncharacterized protein DICPUDRAFT_149887 [Dictyostelium purpureum]EGC37482.1 hypothetical protein DICPUDRAFT_149887 [Dictyostelium purpureum]|eukprot:XP_003285956.1 hypothetical protein DICPUDRAFT_149887 [Dictyostelium purpureum]
MFNLIKKNNLNYLNKINYRLNIINYLNHHNNYNNNNNNKSNILNNLDIKNRNYSTKKKNDDQDDGSANGGGSKILDIVMDTFQKNGLNFDDLKNIKDLKDFKKFNLDKGIDLENDVNTEDIKTEDLSKDDISEEDYSEDYSEDDSEDVDDHDNNSQGPKVTFLYKPWIKRPKSIFPKTTINIKKKVNEKILLENQLKQLTNKFYKEQEVEKAKQKPVKDIKPTTDQQQQPKPQQPQPQPQPKTDIFGFGVNNIKIDKMYELKKKEEEDKKKIEEEKNKLEKERIEKQRIEKEKELKRIEKKRKSFEKKSYKISTETKDIQKERFKKASNKIYKKIKLLELKRSKNRVSNKIKSSNLSTIKFNKTDPFQHHFNMTDLEQILEKYKTLTKSSINNAAESLSFKDRLQLHLYSFQIYLQGNLFKESTPTTMLYNNLNKLILNDQDKKVIEEALDQEDYFKLFEKTREYHQTNFIQDNLAISYAFQYLKKNSKLYRFFQLLESISINQHITPTDYSDMVQAFLNQDQITSAEMLTSNMESYFQEFYPEVFIHYYEHFKKQKENTTTSQVFDEFMGIFNQFSANEKEYMLLYNPIIEREKSRLASLGEPLTEEAINRAIRENPINNSKQLRTLELYKPILIHCYKNSDIEFAEMLEYKMEREGIQLDLETFNNKIKYQATEGLYLNEDNLSALAYNYKPSKKKASSDKFKGNSQTFMAILYHHLIVEKDVKNSLKNLEQLKKKWNFKLNKFVLNQLIWGLSRINNIKESLNYYNQLKQINATLKSNNSNYSDNMNDSVLLYCMSYYNYPSDALINFIKENNTQISKPILDLITFGYLLNNKSKQINNFKINQEINNNNNNNNDNNDSNNNHHNSNINNNNIENLIEVLDYLSNEKSIIIDTTLVQFLLGRLTDLKKQYNIKPSKNHLILLKNLINNNK